VDLLVVVGGERVGDEHGGHAGDRQLGDGGGAGAADDQVGALVRGGHVLDEGAAIGGDAGGGVAPDGVVEALLAGLVHDGERGGPRERDQRAGGQLVDGDGAERAAADQHVHRGGCIVAGGRRRRGRA